ncbi:hypothetical protein [Dysgonomonas gadei]|uniref:Pilus formation protein N-terminal domain-containing protein n=1 Tax=Dysgonomonas gadei ATCC BAA-286 TaxID=742766 RepID=F5J1C4_9BACT|nr:hypothetical protein [Dysgonomonas gadei]EGK00498.1 hypothetical protein HMPREF9455_03141 [Dysgonomonas gadei ATCC BAA-286]
MPKSLSLFIIFTCLLAGFSSCSDNENTEELKVSLTSAKLKLAENQVIEIISGNGEYTIVSDNKDIVDATIETSTIYLSPKKLGSAKLTLKDKLNKEIVIDITVIDRYLILSTNMREAIVVANSDRKEEIADDILKNAFLPKAYAYKLIANEKKVFSVHQNSSTSTVAKGTYSFNTDDGIYYMKLYYDNNEFIYEISSEGDAAMFYQYFNRGIGYNKTSVPVQRHIKLTEDLTQKYKEKYPDAGIESAKIEIITTIHERISALE